MTMFIFFSKVLNQHFFLEEKNVQEILSSLYFSESFDKPALKITKKNLWKFFYFILTNTILAYLSFRRIRWTQHSPLRALQRSWARHFT